MDAKDIISKQLNLVDEIRRKISFAHTASVLSRTCVTPGRPDARKPICSRREPINWSFSLWMSRAMALSVCPGAGITVSNARSGAADPYQTKLNLVFSWSSRKT